MSCLSFIINLESAILIIAVANVSEGSLRPAEAVVEEVSQVKNRLLMIHPFLLLLSS